MKYMLCRGEYPLTSGFRGRTSELDALNPSLRGPAAFLSSFVKGYLLRCESHTRLRMK